jgi:hypothetical protein
MSLGLINICLTSNCCKTEIKLQVKEGISKVVRDSNPIKICFIEAEKSAAV